MGVYHLCETTNMQTANENKTLHVGDDYNTAFDPNVFLSTYYSDIVGCADEGNLLKFMMDFLHDIFSDGKIGGRRLLDVGTGPTIHTVISAAKYVTDIYLSDFCRRNLTALRDWKKGMLAHSFEKLFQYIVDKERKGESARTRELETRNKVKDIFFVDLLADDWPELLSQQPYDVIITSLCLEAAAPTVKVYHSILERLVSLLNPNGYLIMIGVLGESFYKVGDNMFYCLPLTESDTKEICTRCNLDLLHWRSHKPAVPNPQTQSDFVGSFVMVAKHK